MEATFKVFAPVKDLTSILGYQKYFEENPEYFIHNSNDSNVPKVYFEKMMIECVEMNVSEKAFLNWGYYSNLKI